MIKPLLFAALSAIAIVPFAGNGTVAVGDKIPTHKYTEVVWAWDGTESLSDYLGEPVLVDFWGKNCGPCIGSAVPHAIKLQEKLGDQGLHVFLVESQAHGRDEIVPFMAQYWQGRVPMGVLGTNAPFQVAGDMLPKAALIGVDGTIVWTGNGGEGCEKVLDEQLQKLHQIQSLDPALKGVVKDLNARNFGKAITFARGISAKAPNAKAKESADALIAHLTTTVDTRFASAKRLLDAGRAMKAKQTLAQLSKQVAGDKDWSERVATELRGIEDTGHKDELAADKLVCDAEELMKDKKSRADAATKLGEEMKKFASVKVTKYATELKAAAENKSVLK